MANIIGNINTKVVNMKGCNAHVSECVRGLAGLYIQHL